MLDPALSDGSALLAVLDAAMPGAQPSASAPGARARGLAAAAALGDLLAFHRSSWAEVAVGPPRLARFCGRFGSTFPAEREAAYDYSVRLLARAGLTWSSAFRLPPPMSASGASRPPQDAPATAVPAFAAVRGGRPGQSPVPHVPSAPDGSWAATLQGLLDGRALQSAEDRSFLVALLVAVAAGHQVGLQEARTVRNIWWAAEIDPPPSVPVAAPRAEAENRRPGAS